MAVGTLSMVLFTIETNLFVHLIISVTRNIFLNKARGALGFSLTCRNNTSFNVDPADSGLRISIQFPIIFSDLTRAIKNLIEIKVTLTLPIIWITLSAITTVVTLPLLIAAWKNRNPEYLLPWLVLEPFLTFTGIGFASKDFILSTLVGQQHPIDSASSIGAILLVAGAYIKSQIKNDRK
jgi:hypothetical protein